MQVGHINDPYKKLMQENICIIGCVEEGSEDASHTYALGHRAIGRID